MSDHNKLLEGIMASPEFAELMKNLVRAGRKKQLQAIATALLAVQIECCGGLKFDPDMDQIDEIKTADTKAARLEDVQAALAYADLMLDEIDEMTKEVEEDEEPREFPDCSPEAAQKVKDHRESQGFWNGGTPKKGEQA